MRKDAKKTIQTTISNVGTYHGGHWGSESYAFEGFASNKYYTSDRFIPLTDRFQRKDGKPLKGYGLEIETECRGISNTAVLAEVLNKVIFAHFPAGLFKLQHDGSLAGDSSAEAITQIMTREFIRNNYSAFKAMYDHYFPAFGIACGVNCGMHVNISNACFGSKPETQAEAIRKLYYIVNHHFDLCCALFNRDRTVTHYCSRMNASLDYCRTMDLNNVRGGHGVSFNLDHFRSGRIEVRLVGGQKNYACFRNTMESVFHLVDAVKRLSWAECSDPVAIFKGCNQYVYDRLKSKVQNAGQITLAQLEAIRPTVVRAELI